MRDGPLVQDMAPAQLTGARNTGCPRHYVTFLLEEMKRARRVQTLPRKTSTQKVSFLTFLHVTALPPEHLLLPE